MTLELSVQRLMTFKARLLGLMGKKSSNPVYLPGCSAIHTFGMQQPLTLGWLGADQIVIRIDKNVPPRRIKFCKDALGVIEIINPQDADKLKVSKPVKLKGQALVESAFVFPILFLLLFGFLELGLMLQAQQRLTHTIHLAVQTGSLTNNDAKLSTVLASSYELADLTVLVKNYQAQTQAELSAADRRYNDRLDLSVSQPYQLQIPFLEVSPFALQASASARVLCRNFEPPYQCD